MQDIVIDLYCCPVQLHFCEVPLLVHFPWLFVRGNILNTRSGGINFWYISTPFLRKYPQIPPLSLFRCGTSYCNTQYKIQAYTSPPNSSGYLSECFCFLEVAIKKDRVSQCSSNLLTDFAYFSWSFTKFTTAITYVFSIFFLAHGSTLFSCVLPACRVKLACYIVLFYVPFWWGEDNANVCNRIHTFAIWMNVRCSFLWRSSTSYDNLILFTTSYFI